MQYMSETKHLEMAMATYPDHSRLLIRDRAWLPYVLGRFANQGVAPVKPVAWRHEELDISLPGSNVISLDAARTARNPDTALQIPRLAASVGAETDHIEKILFGHMEIKPAIMTELFDYT